MTQNDLQEVYRKRVLDHSRNPHNFGCPDNTNRRAQGFNPLCGDKVTVCLHVTANEIKSVGFEGTGCAISIASASMMTDALQGTSVEDAGQLIQALHKLFSTDAPLESDRLKAVEALEGVRNYPSRIKCATLAWQAAAAALSQTDEQISTE